MVMDTEFCPVGERIPFCGLKVAPILLLADQLISPVELGSSVKVTWQGAVCPQVFASRVVVLTDQVGVTVGDGEGLGDGEGPGDCDGLGDGDGDGVTVVPVTTRVTATCAFPPFEMI